jgi:hypothetical protein
VQLNFADLHFLCVSLCKRYQDAKIWQCYCTLPLTSHWIILSVFSSIYRMLSFNSIAFIRFK